MSWFSAYIYLQKLTRISFYNILFENFNSLNANMSYILMLTSVNAVPLSLCVKLLSKCL